MHPLSKAANGSIVSQQLQQMVCLCFVHYAEVDYSDFTPAFYSLLARILISLWFTNGCNE